MDEQQGALPHFPAEDDPDQRIRMGCPLDGENLRWRYREVTGGDTPAAWTDDDFRDGNSFEWALADYLACAGCRAEKRVEYRGRDIRGREGVTWEWVDCRTVHGRGYYMDLHRKRTTESGKPCFVMTLCQTPLTRKGEMAARQVCTRA